jgi:hypothetical protein
MNPGFRSLWSHETSDGRAEQGRRRLCACTACVDTGMVASRHRAGALSLVTTLREADRPMIQGRRATDKATDLATADGPSTVEKR